MEIGNLVISGNVLGIQECQFKIKNKILYLTLPLNKEKIQCLVVQVLEVAFSIFENIVLIPLLGGTISYQFGVDPRPEKVSYKAETSCYESKPATWSVLLGRPCGIRGIDVGKRCPIEFVVGPNGRITTQSPRVLEQGHATCSGEVMSFEDGSSMLLAPSRSAMSDYEISNDHVTGTAHHELGSVKPNNKIRQSQEQFLIR